MVDRKNVNDIFNVIKDDFNWMIEDMTQHTELVKDQIHKAVDNDDFEEEERGLVTISRERLNN